MHLFEKATREGFLFESPNGFLSITQLWSLPLTHPRQANLNTIAKNINQQLKDLGDEDFVASAHADNSKRETLTAMLDVVKRIIEVKQTEHANASKAAVSKAEISRLKEILDVKRHQELINLSTDELQARIESLSE